MQLARGIAGAGSALLGIKHTYKISGVRPYQYSARSYQIKSNNTSAQASSLA
jgi:hypothetical protein